MLTQAMPETKGKGKITAAGEFVGVIWERRGSNELLCHAAFFFFGGGSCSAVTQRGR